MQVTKWGKIPSPHHSTYLNETSYFHQYFNRTSKNRSNHGDTGSHGDAVAPPVLAVAHCQVFIPKPYIGYLHYFRLQIFIQVEKGFHHNLKTKIKKSTQSCINRICIIM